jgi:hypothetical protein
MKAWMWWAIPIVGGVAYFALRPSAARARLIEDDEGPIVTETFEDPAIAAQALRTHVEAGGNFGTGAQPSPEVAAIQRVLQVADDGIVGPNTRAAARKYGVVLPRRPGPINQAEDILGDKTVSPEAAQAGAQEPEPAEVAATPREQKGSLVAIAIVQLSGMERLAGKGQVEGQIRSGIGYMGQKVGKCPGAPALKGSPSVSARDQRGGRWAVTIRWAGTWQSSGLPQSLKTCITQIARADRELQGRLVELKIARS